MGLLQNVKSSIRHLNRITTHHCQIKCRNKGLWVFCEPHRPRRQHECRAAAMLAQSGTANMNQTRAGRDGWRLVSPQSVPSEPLLGQSELAAGRTGCHLFGLWPPSTALSYHSQVFLWFITLGVRFTVACSVQSSNLVTTWKTVVTAKFQLFN